MVVRDYLFDCRERRVAVVLPRLTRLLETTLAVDTTDLATFPLSSPDIHFSFSFPSTFIPSYVTLRIIPRVTPASPSLQRFQPVLPTRCSKTRLEKRSVQRAQIALESRYSIIRRVHIAASSPPRARERTYRSIYPPDVT